MKPATPSSGPEPPPPWVAWLTLAWIVVCGTAYAHATLVARFPSLAAQMFGR